MAVTSALDPVLGRVTSDKRWLLTVRGPQDAVVLATNEMNRHAKICSRDVAPYRDGQYIGRVAFVPLDGWTSRGGAVREILAQLAFVTEGRLAAVKVEGTDGDWFDVAGCAVFNPVVTGQVIRRGAEAAADTTGRVVTRTAETADRLANAAATALEGAGRIAGSGAEGVGLLGSIFGASGPIGGVVLLAGVAFFVWKFSPLIIPPLIKAGVKAVT